MTCILSHTHSTLFTTNNSIYSFSQPHHTLRHNICRKFFLTPLHTAVYFSSQFNIFVATTEQVHFFFLPLLCLCCPPAIQKQIHDISFLSQASSNTYKTVNLYGEYMQGTVNREQLQTTNDHPADVIFSKVPCWPPFQDLDSQLLHVKGGNPRGWFNTISSSSYISPAIESTNITDVHINIFFTYYI